MTLDRMKPDRLELHAPEQVKRVAGLRRKVGRQRQGCPALRFRINLLTDYKKGLLTRIAIQELLRSRAAANPILLPQAKPRTIR